MSNKKVQEKNASNKMSDADEKRFEESIFVLGPEVVKNILRRVRRLSAATMNDPAKLQRWMQKATTDVRAGLAWGDVKRRRRLLEKHGDWRFAAIIEEAQQARRGKK